MTDKGVRNACMQVYDDDLNMLYMMFTAFPLSGWIFAFKGKTEKQGINSAPFLSRCNERDKLGGQTAHFRTRI